MAVESTGVLSASRKFEDEAARWEDTGKLQWCGINESAFLKLGCALRSKGAKADGVSERLQRYYAAAEARLDGRGPDWHDTFLRTKDWFTECRATFRLENLSLGEFIRHAADRIKTGWAGSRCLVPCLAEIW